MISQTPAPMRTYLAGCALVVLAGLVLSLGILCVRGAPSSDAWQYLFWRAIGFGLVLAVVAARRHGTSPVLQVARLGGFAWLSVVAMVASQACFIGAIKSGSTAEVFFLMSLAPLMAAILARPILGERIGILGMLAIAVALAGVALMSGLTAQGDGRDPGTAEGQWLAWALALGTAFSFALYSIATRGARREDLDAALVAVGIVTALISAIALLWLGLPLAARLSDVGLALLHGGVFLAAGLVLFARGSRAVPGVTLVMLAQAETVSAPVWTYLVFGETTTLSVIAGGALILVAVVMQASDGAGRAARPGAAPETGPSPA
jgi:drug/metabolite transporter (DMT)-like permease